MGRRLTSACPVKFMSMRSGVYPVKPVCSSFNWGVFHRGPLFSNLLIFLLSDLLALTVLCHLPHNCFSFDVGRWPPARSSLRLGETFDLPACASLWQAGVRCSSFNKPSDLLLFSPSAPLPHALCPINFRHFSPCIFDKNCHV